MCIISGIELTSNGGFANAFICPMFIGKCSVRRVFITIFGQCSLIGAEGYAALKWSMMRLHGSVGVLLFKCIPSLEIETKAYM